jgi:Dolichyl-phosphate-mannose-protein mannosyltransferase
MPIMLRPITATFNELLQAIAAQFEVSNVRGARGHWEVPVFIALLLAGCWVRFWGVGAWGLEGDEKTMALPVMHIVQHGTPLFPTGMYYGRAIGQLYMMAGSIMIFGPTEWAMRLPSIVCGIALIPIAYFFGRRFLAPVWNMAFVAVAAFFPVFVADSQEARMYIFLVASLAAFGALVFEWERTGRTRMLSAAVLVMIIGIQFHELAIFGAFLLFFPGFVHGDRVKLRAGAIAFAVTALGFAGIYHWVESFYPPAVHIPGLDVVQQNHVVGITTVLLNRPWMYLAGIACAALLSVMVARPKQRVASARAVGALLFVSILLQLAFFFHLGVLFAVAGLVVGWRQGVRIGPLLIFVIVSLALAAVQFAVLAAAVPDSTRRTIGAMVGLPSIWPYIRFLGYSAIGAAIVGIGLVNALWRLARSRPIPEYWLFLLLTVLVPLWAIGCLRWDVEDRYTEVALLPVLLCALAVCQQLAAALIGLRRGVDRAVPMPAQAWMAAAVCVLIINPLRLSKIVNAGYSIHPDHKGAAQYIQSLHLRPNDVIVAEDSLEQTYYLGHVDYWLLGKNIGQQFVRYDGGELRDIYTDARLIGTGPELMALVGKPNQGNIYIIGSGELQEDGRRYMRSMGIFEALQLPIFEPVYLGRDGLTKVWRVRKPSGGQTASAVTG